MLIDVRDDRIVNVRGNPDHPFTRGGLCIKVNNYGDRVHSPDRRAMRTESSTTRREWS